MGTTGKSEWGKVVTWIIGTLMAVFVSLVLYTTGQANAAVKAAYDAGRKAEVVAADLSVHKARQNGSLEAIQSQLSTLRGYHSTNRAEHKDIQKVLDELLRHSYEHSTSVP